MPLYLAILKYVNMPTDKWGPKDEENLVGRYGSIRKKCNLKIAEENLAFEPIDLHRF